MKTFVPNSWARGLAEVWVAAPRWYNAAAGRGSLILFHEQSAKLQRTISSLALALLQDLEKVASGIFTGFHKILGLVAQLLTCSMLLADICTVSAPRGHTWAFPVTL